MAAAEVVRNAGLIKPDTEKFGEVLSGFEFEGGAEIVDGPVEIAAGLNHAAEGSAEVFGADGVFEGKDKETAFGCEYVS